MRLPRATVLALLLASTGGNAFGAEAWPSRAIRFIVPYPPAGTPQPIVDRLSRESMKILQSDEIKKRFAEVGAEPVGGTQQEFAAFMAAETIKWAKVIKASGARVD